MYKIYAKYKEFSTISRGPWPPLHRAFSESAEEGTWFGYVSTCEKKTSNLWDRSKDQTIDQWPSNENYPKRSMAEIQRAELDSNQEDFFCCCCLLDHRRSWESERDIESDSGSHHNVGAPAKETTLRCERRGKMTGAMYSGNYMLAF